MTIERAGEEEVWTRCFGAARFVSRLSLAPDPGRLVERFGPFRFDLDVRVEAGSLILTAEGWRLGPMPMPRFLCPRSQAKASVDDQGHYVFDVPIHLPSLGRLVHYRGRLKSLPPMEDASA